MWETREGRRGLEGAAPRACKSSYVLTGVMGRKKSCQFAALKKEKEEYKVKVWR